MFSKSVNVTLEIRFLHCKEKKPSTSMGRKNLHRRLASAVKKPGFQSMFEELGWLHKAQLPWENLMAFLKR